MNAILIEVEECVSLNRKDYVVRENKGKFEEEKLFYFVLYNLPDTSLQ